MVEPGSALFRRLRLQLTLWYVAVLALALVATGAGVYLVLRVQILRPANTLLRSQAAFHAQRWQQSRTGTCFDVPPEAPPEPPPGVRPPSLKPVFAACFDPGGHVLSTTSEPRDPEAPLPASLLTTTLLAGAQRSGSATDVVDLPASGDRLLRYALVVRSPGGQVQGFVQVGQTVTELEDTLALVRNVLAGAGLLALLGAGAGGWLLAGRAIAPATLAFARQQDFISDAAHELRTPLTLLRATAELLLRQRNCFPTDAAESLDDIVAETEHMGKLAEHLLTLARLDVGHLQLEREIVDLSQLAQQLVRRVAALARSKGVAVSVTIPESNPRALVLGDADYLIEAGLILMENAVKFTPAGGCVIASVSGGEQMARLTVSDTGIGIPADHLPRLGQRFYRVDKARSRASGGAGLGLAIAFRIAAAHGGSIQIESRAGAGTRAALVLPAAPPL